jgi:nitroimidazol reductase NimA-like FMN-containing flavoprotein (pyridoxamine 5'-phosphate oxidase superfamily)
MMSTNMTPSFRELDRAECDAILARNQLGRIAFAFHDRVDIGLRVGDPVPFRDVLIRIHVDEITGRAASTSGS